MLEIFSDIMLGIGAIGAAVYCMVLSRRLRRFNNLQNGMGGAVAVLSAQVDDMTKTIDNAQQAASQSAEVLSDLTERAEASAKTLELMMASLHDLPEPIDVGQVATQTQEPEQQVSPSDAPPSTQPIFSSHRVLEAAQ